MPVFVLEVRSGVASAGELSIGKGCCGVTFGVVHGLFAILVAHLVPKSLTSLAVQLVIVEVPPICEGGPYFGGEGVHYFGGNAQRQFGYTHRTSLQVNVLEPFADFTSRFARSLMMLFAFSVDIDMILKGGGDYATRVRKR